MSSNLKTALLTIAIIAAGYFGSINILLYNIHKLNLRFENELMEMKMQINISKMLFESRILNSNSLSTSRIPKIKFELPLKKIVIPEEDDIWPKNSNKQDDPDFMAVSTLHFRICSYNTSLLNFLSARVENYYNNIIDDLGLHETNIIPKQIQVFIFRDNHEYREITNNPIWSGGCIYIDEKKIYSYEGKHLAFTIPHELTHLIFETFLEGKVDLNRIRLINEGIAVYEEMRSNKNHRYAILRFLAKRFRKGEKIPFSSLINPNSLSSSSSKEYVDLWYAQAGVIIDFLINEKEQTKFIEFCRGIKKYSDINKALQYSYLGEFNSISDLEKPLKDYIKKF